MTKKQTLPNQFYRPASDSEPEAVIWDYPNSVALDGLLKRDLLPLAVLLLSRHELHPNLRLVLAGMMLPDEPTMRKRLEQSEERYDKGHQELEGIKQSLPDGRSCASAIASCLFGVDRRILERRHELLELASAATHSPDSPTIGRLS